MTVTNRTIGVNRAGWGISGTIFSATLPFALTIGIKIEDIESTFDISAKELFSVEARLPDIILPRLWLMMEERRPGEALPILVARGAPFSAMAGLSQAAQFADNLHAALRLFRDHNVVLADRVEFDVVVDGDTAALTIHHPLDELDLGMSNQAGLGLFWRLIVEILEVDVDLIAVELGHACKGDVAVYEDFFNAPVRQHAERYALVFATADLNEPVAHACADLFAYAEEHFRQMSSRIGDNGPPDEFARLQQAILKNAEQGRFDPASAAAAAGLSLRTAQRIASNNGASVLELIDAVRAEMAKDLLLRPGATNDAVGAMIGYSDGRAFRRAFKRWTGSSPSRFRQEHAAGGARRNDD